MTGLTNIFKAGKVIFAYDESSSIPPYSEVFRAEQDLKVYVLNIDHTMPPTPYYELFEEFREKGRILHNRLFASSQQEKMVEWIKDYIV